MLRRYRASPEPCFAGAGQAWKRSSSRRGDLNSRLPPYHGGTLPLSYDGKFYYCQPEAGAPLAQVTTAKTHTASHRDEIKNIAQNER